MLTGRPAHPVGRRRQAGGVGEAQLHTFRGWGAGEELIQAECRGKQDSSTSAVQQVVEAAHTHERLRCR